MQTANVNLPITVTGRHVSVTESMRDYALKKIEGLHLDYPRIIEAKVILDVEKNRQRAEVILFCANHITIEASTESEDLYASIDETVSKIARRMRKHKTRLLKSHRPRKQTIRHLEEQVFSGDLPISEEEEVEPLIVHKENYRIRPMFTEEAIMDMEISERNFLVFQNAKNERLSIVFRRNDGDYGVIEPQAE
jgi:putative sigma-54 modulation protein